VQQRGRTFRGGQRECCSQFLRSYDIAQQDIDTVWKGIALHTTPGIPQHTHPVALVTAGGEMDVLGIKYGEYSDAEPTQWCGPIRARPTSRKT
jgi:hypothetical protein